LLSVKQKRIVIAHKTVPSNINSEPFSVGDYLFIIQSPFKLLQPDHWWEAIFWIASGQFWLAPEVG